MAFSELANDYLDWCQRRFAKKTYDYKAMVYRCFLDYHGDLAVAAVSSHHVHLYCNTRPTNNNYNSHRKELCALFSYGRKQLKIPMAHPCWDLQKMPVERTEKEIPTQKDVLKLITASNQEERAFILTILHTLARVDEILRLKWKDVNFTRRVVTLWSRKKRGGEWKPRYIPMNKDLYSILWSMWKKRKQDVWIYLNEKTGTRYNRRPKMMKGLCKNASIEHFGFHALRHFGAFYLNDVKKIGMKTVSTILGHETEKTTEIYLHSVDESQRTAMESLEGVFGIMEGRNERI